VVEDDTDERRDRHQRAVAATSGALLGGAIAGPIGIAVGAGLAPLLEPLVEGVWAELSTGARQRQLAVLASAIDNGIPEDDMRERISASDRTQLLTGFALSAATRTAWEDKLRTLGRSLASGLLTEDNAKIDTEQMIIAAIADIEAPQLVLLELLVCWQPLHKISPFPDRPLDIPEYSYRKSYDIRDSDGWNPRERKWSAGSMAVFRPNLAPILPSILGGLQRHGLVAWKPKEGDDSVILWSPTELGEQVFLRFRDAGTELPDAWTSGPAGT